MRSHIWGGAPLLPIAALGQYKAWWAAMARAVTRGEVSPAESSRIQRFDRPSKTIIRSAMSLSDVAEWSSMTLSKSRGLLKSSYGRLNSPTSASRDSRRDDLRPTDQRGRT